MPYLDSFDDWDPWGDDKLPDTLPWSLRDIRDRACKILAGRSQRDLRRAAKSIYLINIRAQTRAIVQVIKQMAAEDKAVGYSSDFNTVRWGVENLDLSEFPLFPDARPADYLAVFALAVIGDLLLHHRNADGGELSIAPAPFVYGAVTTELTAAATEAIAYAEQLIKEQSLAGKTRTCTARRGGQKRADKFRPLREECILLATAYLDERSSLAAARRIYASLGSQSLGLFESSDTEQHITTIARWLREEFKSRWKRPKND